MTHYGAYEPVNQSKIQMCCITMNMADRLRLLACPADSVPLIRDAIINSWTGIQAERSYHGSHEFKLVGSPWHASGEDSVAARRLLAAILTTMATLGWNLIQSTDVSKREGDKDSLFFEKGIVDTDARLFVVSFNMRNRLRLIDAPDLITFVEDAVTQFWPLGMDDKKWFNGCWELKLRGYPWYPISEDAIHSKLLLSKVLANFRSIGFKLYASVDLSYGTEGTDLETWVFRRIWHDLEYVPTPCQACGEYSHGKDNFGEDENEKDSDAIPEENNQKF